MQSLKRRNAFTLVELLVVIGIIALLISMLLPALNKAKQASNTVKCASNLRQIGLAFALYENQYQGFVPAGQTNYPSPDPQSWPDLITPLMNKNMKSYDFAWAMRCPSNDLVNVARSHPEAYSYAVGIGLNGDLMRGDIGPLPRKISKVKHSSERIIVFETNSPLGVVGSVSFDFSGNKSVWNWHNHGANFLLCDGSVQYMKDPWFELPSTSRTTDGTTATKKYWFRTTQSATQYNTGAYDRLYSTTAPWQ